MGLDIEFNRYVEGQRDLTLATVPGTYLRDTAGVFIHIVGRWYVWGQRHVITSHFGHLAKALREELDSEIESDQQSHVTAEPTPAECLCVRLSKATTVEQRRSILEEELQLSAGPQYVRKYDADVTSRVELLITTLEKYSLLGEDIRLELSY